MPPKGHAKEIPWEHLWSRVSTQFSLGHDSLHGPLHWRRVEVNGMIIATDSGADLVVVRLFALFHDSRRENEFRDDGHGKRGADLGRSMRGVDFALEDTRFDLLTEACEGHTEINHHTNPTIQTCWDADRLDLPRVGILPDPAYLNTVKAKDLCLNLTGNHPL